MFKKCRASVKLAWVLLAEILRAGRALLRGDPSRAGMHLRNAATALHDDLVKVLVGLQRLLPLWRRPPADIDRILIVKLDRIGDMVNTTPVFDALRAAYPGARLDVLGHPGPLSLLEGDERVGERIGYRSWLYHALPIRPGGPRAWHLVCKLLWRRYPLVVYLRGSFPFLWLALTSRLAAARFVRGEPVVTRYLKALEPLLGPVAERRTRLHVDPAAADFAGRLLGRGPGRDGPRVGIHATASSTTKTWPAERFAALADRLVDTCGAEVHFLGGPEDGALLNEIARLTRHPHSFHCSLRLPQVVAVIAACDLFIGNDSGLSHIAAAVGTRLVVLWGPANLSMARPEALPEDCTVLYHELPCRESCPETSCVNPVQFECLLRTQVEDVLTAARDLLGPAGRRTLSLVGQAVPFELARPTTGATCQRSEAKETAR